jgi:formiminotetrahydrofolate cyclodeaminase
VWDAPRSWRAPPARAIKSERVDREKAIQVALRASAEVPLEVVRLCVCGLRHAQTVAGHIARFSQDAAAAANVSLGGDPGTSPTIG